MCKLLCRIAFINQFTGIVASTFLIVNLLLVCRIAITNQFTGIVASTFLIVNLLVDELNLQT